MNDSTFVIVGASLTGAKAAESLRKEGFDGRVVLIGEEPSLPYERPPLSKDFLRAETERDGTLVHPESFYLEQNIELRRSTRASEVRPSEREVILGDDERLPFERLLLATGAAVRRLSIGGSQLSGVHYLRTVEDSGEIRAGLLPGARVVIVGAGWIGAEVAASARQKGADVTLIDPLPVPLQRVLGPAVGAVYRDLHREHGVELRLGERVEAFEGREAVERVRLADGTTVEADLVVAGIGVTPRIEVAEQAGIDVNNGIVVNERLETSVPGIFAAGDVANHRHPQFGPLRIEHWANAQNQGLAVGRAMLGNGEHYAGVPYFFSDQYDVGMEYSGHASGDAEVVFRGDPESREFIAFWLRGERVVAGMNVGVWEVTEPIQALVRTGATIDRKRLSDPGQPLDELLSAEDAARLRGPRMTKQAPGVPKRFVGDRVAMRGAGELDALLPGHGAIVDGGGEKVAAYRDEDGRVHAVSPICTHRGCVVGWNGAETSWDCPCHGSRFETDGSVLRGPAKKGLEVIAPAPSGQAPAA